MRTTRFQQRWLRMLTVTERSGHENRLSRFARRTNLNCAWLGPSGWAIPLGGVAPSMVNLPGARHMHFRASPPG